ncbi:MAG: DUF1501 domain-containing protein [Planctomycetales bacterium]
MSMLLVGGGCRRGRVVGATNAKGDFAIEGRISPADVLATIYRRMGIDSGTQFIKNAGRPIPITNDGAMIRDLL